MLKSSSLLAVFLACIFLVSCLNQKKLAGEQADISLKNDSLLKTAHVGIAVYDASSGKYIYEFQDDKYFTPASNTKLFSLYAGMKYLGDSLPGIQYLEIDTAIFLRPTGDPTFLHPDYPLQPVIGFLKKNPKNKYVLDGIYKDQPWGAGWSWDDYIDEYMVERSALPVYGNIVRWIQQNPKNNGNANPFGSSPSIFSQPEVDWKLRFSTDTGQKHFYVKRKLGENVFEATQGTEEYAFQDVPFITNGVQSAVDLLRDTIGPGIFVLDPSGRAARNLTTISATKPWMMIRSQPVDSMFRPMMLRSDNFFAEQILMMVSTQKLGIMNDEAIVDSMLKTDLAALPQIPHWADGSGLSRFNLFTPQDFIWILDHLQSEFGLERMKRLLPTGGMGTLKNYYKQDSGYIFAKTGSLSNVLALSGYLISKKNHLMIFSILINNYQGSPAAIRRAIERFLLGFREKN